MWMLVVANRSTQTRSGSWLPDSCKLERLPNGSRRFRQPRYERYVESRSLIRCLVTITQYSGSKPCFVAGLFTKKGRARSVNVICASWVCALLPRGGNGNIGQKLPQTCVSARQYRAIRCVAMSKQPAAGLIAALGGFRPTSSLLFGISARDPIAFAGATVFLIAVAMVAILIPATRAARVDPMFALRHE
jgi:hypothetical protein